METLFLPFNVGAFINGAGDISVPITVDIDGDSRPLAGSTVVDPGADEFNPPLCPPSVNLGATNITLTSADIFWDGVTIDYQYEVVLAGAGQGTGTVIRTALDSITITGLTPSTAYEFYTREICGRGDTSIWIGPFAFGTANGVPYFQDFEGFTIGTSVFEEGWINRNGTTGPNWQPNNRTGSFGTGPVADNTTGTAVGKFIYLETSTGAGVDTLVSPPIFIDPTQSVVVLEYFIHMHGAAMGSMEVYVDSNGVLNQLNTLVGQQTAVQTDPWTPYTHTLAGYGGNSIVLKFVGIRGTSFTSDMAVDDVRVFEPSPEDGGVTDILSPTSGCGLGTADSVTVEISNLGTATLDTIPVVYILNGGTPVVETYFDSIPPGQTANFTFSATVNLSTFGSYSLVAYTDLLVDGDATNDTTTVSINNIPLVASFPYSEDFETSNGGWTASGANNTWAWGTPAGSVIASAAGGTGAWVTNLTGNYNNNESSFIESPCLDLSSLSVDPILTFSLTYDTESCCDEGWIDYSTDGGLTWSRLIDNGGALEWYNDIGNQWWDGTSSGGAGVWVTAENTLTGLAGQSSVKIRVGFSSDGSVVRDGFGIDDVSIDLPQAFNMRLANIVTPVSGAYTPGLTDSIRVTLENVGSDTATNFTVNYVLNGGPVVTETIASVLPGVTFVHVFNSSIALPAAGQADTLDVYVDFAADIDNSNDSILGYIFDNDIKGVPYLEDFENSYVLGNVLTNQQGGWSSTRANSPDWEIEDASGTNENSTATGPFFDRTTFGTAGGFYAYLECSGGALGDQDTMRSPSILIPANATAMSLDYSYHMFGADMGTLELFMEANGAYTRLDSVGGSIQLAGDSAWSDTSIALTGAFNGQIVNIVFVGSRGNGFTSDMSIDDISLDFVTGVNAVASELEGISISPNPSNGLFKLTIETPSEDNFNMTVRDAQGRSVYTANFDVNGTYRNDLDFTSFAKGVYYMQ
ncbi:T9SS type A sorting domain-containing protein, partial [Vicingaceae bacterium]|nr:T9SS type A sorting domain-containing protein [Vicingaceae bacterium]